MRNHYLKQIEFEKWANDLTIKAIAEAINPPERALQLLAHVLGTFSIWLSRITDHAPRVGRWDTLTLEQCRLLNEENHNRWTEYLNSIPDSEFERIILFDFFGEQSTISINDIIVHSINHGSYHRGQIIISLKGKLEKLPLTTYIAFARVAD